MCVCVCVCVFWLLFYCYDYRILIICIYLKTYLFVIQLLNQYQFCLFLYKFVLLLLIYADGLKHALKSDLNCLQCWLCSRIKVLDCSCFLCDAAQISPDQYSLIVQNRDLKHQSFQIYLGFLGILHVYRHVDYYNTW